jgi:signal transduction histidine kinase
MDYGNNTLLGPSGAPKRPSAGVVGVHASAEEAGKHKPADFAAMTRAIARDIRHPLAAILANANAAQRWLSEADASLAEALAALDRIVKDVARIDAAIDGICATGVEQVGKAGLT